MRLTGRKKVCFPKEIIVDAVALKRATQNGSHTSLDELAAWDDPTPLAGLTLTAVLPSWRSFVGSQPQSRKHTSVTNNANSAQD